MRKRWEGGLTELPGEDCGRVLEAVDKELHVVLVGLLDLWHGVELRKRHKSATVFNN
jgi:hypothetical protein